MLAWLFVAGVRVIGLLPWLRLATESTTFVLSSDDDSATLEKGTAYLLIWRHCCPIVNIVVLDQTCTREVSGGPGSVALISSDYSKVIRVKDT